MVSTVLFVSGVTTLLHTSFGSRLPLIQGPSFVYLAPALAIINSPEFRGLNGNVCYQFLCIYCVEICDYVLLSSLAMPISPTLESAKNSSLTRTLFSNCKIY